jgi:hypothetical protein
MSGYQVQQVVIEVSSQDWIGIIIELSIWEIGSEYQT